MSDTSQLQGEKKQINKTDAKVLHFIRVFRMNRAVADINSPSVEEKSSVSRVKKSHGLYSFRVEGYSGLSTRVGDSTESPEFELCGHVWQLRIFPGGSLEAHRSYLSFYLASKSSRSARASYKLSVCSQVAGGTDESFASSGVSKMFLVPWDISA